MNLTKTLINMTPVEFIFIAIDTLWKKLSCAPIWKHHLTGNRLAEKITLGRAVRESDVRKLLERRITNWENGDIKQAVRIVSEKANGSTGLYAFIREVCKRANEKAGADEVTLEIFTNAVAEEAASR